jgi:hypothetical protein
VNRRGGDRPEKGVPLDAFAAELRDVIDARANV